MDFFDIYEKEVRQQYEQTPELEQETGMFDVEEQKETNENIFDYDKLANIIFEKIKEERKEQKNENIEKEEIEQPTE